MGHCSSKNSSPPPYSDSSHHNFSFLLLGSSDSGKSTILKQLKRLHTPKGFSEEERIGFRKHIYNNVVSFFKMAIQGTVDLNGVTGCISADLSQDEELIRNVEPAGGSEILFSPVLTDACKALWKDPAIQMALLHRAKLGIEGDPKYFMDAMDRISADNYIPSEDDIVRCRVTTRGVSQIVFKLEEAQCTVIDVGGQRSERRKWIHLFQDVDAILYVVSLSEYDQMLMDDGTTNRSREALSVFKSVLKTSFLKHAPVMLFLNKSDVLQEKIRRVSLDACFSDYYGGHDYNEAVSYFKGKYKALGKKYRPSDEAKLYIHITCALDEKQVEFVFNSARDTVLKKNLLDCGLTGAA